MVYARALVHEVRATERFSLSDKLNDPALLIFIPRTCEAPTGQQMTLKYLMRRERPNLPNDSKPMWCRGGRTVPLGK